MTVQEAIKELQVAYLGDTFDLMTAKHEAIKALERQIPKKPKDMQDDANGIDVWVTCECGAMMLINTDLHKQGYCRKCGQLMEFPQPFKKEGAE